MITVLVIVVLAMPTAVWFAMRARSRREDKPEIERSGPKHRWWMP